MRIFPLVVAVIALLGGGTALTVGTLQGTASLVTSGSAIVVAALALIGVAAGITTWRDERRAKQVEERQRATGEVLAHLMGRFGAGFDPVNEARRRSDLAIWGNKGVVAALAHWNQVFDDVVPSGSTGTVVLSSIQQAALQVATADVARAIRLQFDRSDRTTTAQLAAALFNDFQGSRRSNDDA